MQGHDLCSKSIRVRCRGPLRSRLKYAGWRPRCGWEAAFAHEVLAALATLVTECESSGMPVTGKRVFLSIPNSGTTGPRPSGQASVTRSFHGVSTNNNFVRDTALGSCGKPIRMVVEIPQPCDRPFTLDLYPSLFIPLQASRSCDRLDFSARQVKLLSGNTQTSRIRSALNRHRVFSYTHVPLVLVLTSETFERIAATPHTKSTFHCDSHLPAALDARLKLLNSIAKVRKVFCTVCKALRW